MSAKIILDDGTTGVPKSLTTQAPVALLDYGILEARERCQILILSEGFPTYERAVEVCRRIMAQVDDDLEFDFKSWNIFELADSNCARAVFKEAGLADIILFSIQGTDLPAVAVEWLETLPAFRARAEGVLAVVLNASANPASVEKLVLWMEQSARRMGMDFLQQAVSPVEPEVVPSLFATPANHAESREWDHWGLNE